MTSSKMGCIGPWCMGSVLYIFSDYYVLLIIVTYGMCLYQSCGFAVRIEYNAKKITQCAGQCALIIIIIIIIIHIFLQQVQTAPKIQHDFFF